MFRPDPPFEALPAEATIVELVTFSWTELPPVYGERSTAFSVVVTELQFDSPKDWQLLVPPPLMLTCKGTTLWAVKRGAKLQPPSKVWSGPLPSNTLGA